MLTLIFINGAVLNIRMHLPIQPTEHLVMPQEHADQQYHQIQEE
jgi:hypothetical protein